nr:hypothetical protein [Entamoeba invadens]
MEDPKRELETKSINIIDSSITETKEISSLPQDEGVINVEDGCMDATGMEDVQPILFKESRATLPLFSVSGRNESGFTINCETTSKDTVSARGKPIRESPHNKSEKKEKRCTQLKKLSDYEDCVINEDNDEIKIEDETVIPQEKSEGEDTKVMQVERKASADPFAKKYTEIRKKQIFPACYTLLSKRDEQWVFERNNQLSGDEMATHIKRDPNRMGIIDCSLRGVDVKQTWSSLINEESGTGLSYVYPLGDGVFSENKFKEEVIKTYKKDGFVDVYVMYLKKKNVLSEWMVVCPGTRNEMAVGCKKANIPNKKMLVLLPVPMKLEKDEYYVVYKNYLKRRSANDIVAIYVKMK